MTTSFVLLFMDEHFPRVQFVCPLCDSQTIVPAPETLGILHCSHCGITVDASEATVHILNVPSRIVPAAPSPRMIW